MSPESLQERLNASMESSEQKYYYRIVNKSNNIQNNFKSCWSLSKVIGRYEKYF